jgi:membrane protease YdiL (CAAX protease family)
LALCFAYLAFAAWVTFLNENIVFPEALAGIEQAFQEMEEQLRKVTLYLIQFETLPQFFVALLVIAAIPGFGEELLFRGVLQNKFYAIFKNKHVAVWISAIIFGIIHLQFYGVITRTLLGALFGYLFVYSGNLFYPMLSHFLNNALTLIFTRLYFMGEQEEGGAVMEAPEIPIWWALISLSITLVLVYWFKKKAIKPHWV